jgi:hypothetical protein
MPAVKLKVTHINKRDHYNPHERIQNIAGVLVDGTPWKLTVDQAIMAIESGIAVYYVALGTYVIDLIIATHEGRKYLKTVADTTTNNNLLNLPECWW